MEFEKPMMQAIPGGAAAQPFKTHHNALGCDFYLRIALELYLKRLLVGGVDKVFEIGRNFRNEGLSRKHNPEFTMLEAYQAFGDYESMMELVESMVKHVAQKVLGTLIIKHDAKEIIREAIHEAIEKIGRLASLVTSANVRHAIPLISPEALLLAIKKAHEVVGNLKEIEVDLGIKSSAEVAKKASDELETLRLPFFFPLAEVVSEREGEDADLSEAGKYLRPILASAERLKKLSEPKIIDLTNWRRAKYKDLVREKAGADWFEISPEARRQRAHDLGAEITKDYADFEVTGAVFEKLIEPTLIQPTFVTHLPKELVPLAKLSPDDPATVEVFECCINGQEIAPAYTEQNDPIEQRERLEHQAGGEQQKLDEDFLVALEHGMPPAGGMGMGIDRLCMMLLGQESIRDVILFPQLKPK